MDRFMDFMGAILLWFLALLIPLAFVGAIIGVKENLDKGAYCKEKGGVPVTDQGVYKACAKPDSYIILDSDK